MSGDQWVGVIGIAGAMTLVASSLIVRRLPLPRLATMVLAWAGIFLAAFAIARTFG